MIANGYVHPKDSTESRPEASEYLLNQRHSARPEGDRMACCGRSRIGRVRRAIAAPRPRTIAPAVGKRDISGAVSELCSMIAEQGDSLTVKFIKGILTIPKDGTSFELFSAIKSQGCIEGAEWAPTLEKRWKRMTVLGRTALVKKLGKTEITIREILNALG